MVMHVQAYVNYDAVRPLGCSLMLGSYSVNARTELYDATIRYFICCWGCATGKAGKASKTEIEKLQMKEMTYHDVV